MTDQLEGKEPLPTQLVRRVKRLNDDGSLYRAKTVRPPGLAAALLAQHAAAREAAEAAAQEAAAEPGPRLRKKPKIENAFIQLVPDLAYNKETICIPVSGPSGFPPPKFEYITKMVYSDDVEIPQPIGCQCHRGCRAATTCRCLFLNTDEPYDPYHRLQIYRALIFECNKNCKCIDKCLLRSSQQQQIPQLEVFLSSEQKGWGVRSLDRIPKGTLVCEYLGFMRRFEHAHNNTKYGFDISCLRVIREIVKEDGLPSGYKLALPDESEGEFDVGFNIDAEIFGNIARFINHSCEANVFAQCIAYHSEDMTLSAKSARIMLFADRDIDVDEEITLDYHSAGPNEVECLCGAENCRKIFKF